MDKIINLNDVIKVKLNQEGKNILALQHFIDYPVDENGFIQIQLWSAMRIFGSYMAAGLKPPFETQIILVDKIYDQKREPEIQT